VYLLRGLISLLPNRLKGVFLLDALGIVLLQFNYTGINLLVFSSAYVFCVTGFYVIYRVLVPVEGG
jgi:hypothetical protein